MFAIISIMVSCSSPATHELVVDVNVSDVLMNEVRNPNKKEFKEVYNATMDSHKKKKGDFIEMFFIKAKELNPGTPFIRYFKTDSGLSMSSSDEEVKEHFIELRETSLDIVKEILSVRLDNLGVTYAKVDSKKAQVKFGLSGAVDENKLRRLVQTSGNLQFFEMYRSEEIIGAWMNAASTNNSLKKVQSYGPFFFVSRAHKNEVDRAIKSKEIQDLFPRNLKCMWGYEVTENQDSGEKGYLLYLCKIPDNGRAFVDGSDVKGAVSGVDSSSGASTVDVTMTQEGSDKWAKMTTRNIDRSIAIVVSEKVMSAPNVINAITGGTTQISGSFSPEEAEELAHIISIGNLPVGCLFNKLKKL